MSQEENSHLGTTCPHCGAMDQEIGSRCEGCGRLIAEGIPEWAQKMPRRGLFGRQGLIFMTQNKWLLIVLSVIAVAAVVWHNYHVIPNPVTLLQTRPSTNLSSLSEPGQWSMLAANYERTSYVPNPPSLPQGNLLWSTEAGLIEGQSLPAIVDSTLYVGSRFKFMALDANTGQTKWLRDMPGLVNSSPAVAGDNVYAGSTDTKVWVFDKDTGDTRWTFNTDNYISSSPMVANGYLFIGSGDNSMYALDAATGEKLWEFPTENLITAPPSLYKGVLYFSSQDNSLYSVNYRTGEGRMRFRTRGVASFEPAGDVPRTGVHGLRQRHPHGQGRHSGDPRPMAAGEAVGDPVAAVGRAHSEAAVSTGDQLEMGAGQGLRNLCAGDNRRCPLRGRF